MEPADYERLLLSAIGAPITSRLSRNLPTIDADACVAHLSDAITGVTGDPTPRSPLAHLTNGRPSSTPLPADAPNRALAFDDESVDEFECEVETSGLCDAGALVGHENLVPGAAVAVPFRLNGVEVHYAGHILRPAPPSSTGIAQYDVSFPDGDIYRAQHDRLFAVVELGSLPAGT
jgi:hypothetical protein